MTPKTHSAVEPSWYFLDEIRTKDNMPLLILRINWDIITSGGDAPGWQYNSQPIVHIPSSTLLKTEVKSYIETHKTELLAQAENEWNAPEVIDADITEIREQALVPNYEEKIFTEKEVYGATITEINVTKPDKKYIKVKLLNRNVTRWCYAAGSVLRDYSESKIDVGNVVIVLYDPDNQYPIVMDRVIL